MTDKKIVLSTCATEEDAERIARALLERRVAACVNIVSGVRSLYRWKGAIEDNRELLLVIKTTAGAIEALKAAIGEVHPYEVPEMVVLPIEDGSTQYLDWIGESIALPDGASRVSGLSPVHPERQGRPDPEELV